MGKTLWGIDLDESPAGGLIERLLTDEELEALADGGRPVDDDDEDGVDAESDADDEEKRGDGDETGADDGGFEFDVTTDDGADDRGESDGEDGVDVSVERDDDGGFDVDVETDDEDVEIDVDVDDGEVDLDVGARGASMVDPDAETPSPGSESGSLRDRFPSIGGSDESAEGGDGEHADDESGGIAAKIRPHLLKIAVAGVVLAVVALVAWRYLGTVKSVAGDKLGRGDSESEADDFGDDVTEVDAGAGPDVDEDAPAARRRAKAARSADAEVAAETELGESVAADADTDPEAEAGDEDDDDAGVARSGDSDMGALLGLAFLALVAALVRKFSEEREHDPLVDGPE